MGNIEEERDAVIDKFLDATYGLWNALLTVNGIVLAIFAAFPQTSSAHKLVWIRAILVSSVLSSCLLILNYLMRKQTYHHLIEILSDSEKVLAPTEVRKNNSAALMRHRLGCYCENAALILFLIEAFCIVHLAFIEV